MKSLFGKIKWLLEQKWLVTLVLIWIAGVLTYMADDLDITRRNSSHTIFNFSAIKTKLDSIDTTISEIQSDSSSIDSSLDSIQDDINSIESDVDYIYSNTNKLGNIGDTLDSIESKVDSIEMNGRFR